VNASRAGPFALRRGRAGCASRLATEGISGWWSARLSRGPRKTNLGGLRSYARGSGQKAARRKRARRRRQRYQRRTDRFARTGRTSPRVASSESRSEKRTVKRASPRSRLHRRAPSLPVRGDERLRTRGAVTRKDVRVEEHGAARLRDESDRTSAPTRFRKEERAPRPVAALGTRRSTSARVERFRSAESRSDATFGRDARERPRPGGRHAETRDLARRNLKPPPTRRLRRRASEGAARTSPGIF